MNQRGWGRSDFQGGFSRQEQPPLAAGVVRGVRVWSVDRPAMPTVNSSPPGTLVGQYGHRWVPGENTAECRKAAIPPSVMGAKWGFDMKLKLPEPCDGVMPDCTCGFYAYWDVGDDEVSTGPHGIVGVIEGYGKTTIGEHGFRCEKARIIALAPAVDSLGHRVVGLGDSTMQAIAERYNVPVFSSGAAMLEKFPADDAPEVEVPAKDDRSDKIVQAVGSTGPRLRVHAVSPAGQAVLDALNARARSWPQTRRERIRDWWGYKDGLEKVATILTILSWPAFVAYMVLLFIGWSP